MESEVYPVDMFIYPAGHSVGEDSVLVHVLVDVPAPLLCIEISGPASSEVTVVGRLAAVVNLGGTFDTAIDGANGPPPDF